MSPQEAFEMVEKQLLDCTYSRLRVFNFHNMEECTIMEVYEAEGELCITIQEKEYNENNQ